MGLSPKYFTILTFQEARHKYYDSKPYDFSLKPSDTLILSKVDTFKNKIEINNKKIRYKFDMSGIVFMEDVDISFCTFNEKVYFYGTQFNKLFIANNTIFDGTIIFQNVRFMKSMQFNSAKFHLIGIDDCRIEEDASFFNAKFLGEVYFMNSIFNKGCYFQDSKFYFFTRFSGSVFTQSPMFWEAQFYDTVFFNYVKLMDGIDFQSTKISKYISLNSLETQGKIYFDNTYLPEYIDLSNIKSKYPIDFNFINDSIKNKKYKINIYKTDLNNLILTDRFSLWFDNYLNLDQKNSIYKQLLEVLDHVGYRKVSKSIDIEYRGFINKNYNGFFERIGFALNRIWWNYGYNKQRIFLISLILILLFSIPIYLKFDYFVDNAYKIDTLSKRFKDNRSIENKFTRYSLDYLVALLYTIFIFFNLKLSFEKLSFKSYKGGLYILIIFTIGLFCSAFIINLIVTK